MKNLIILLSCLLFAGSVYGWGQKGHDVTAYIAECHLTPEAAQKIDKVLNGHSPVYYCNWMDIASHTPEYNYTKTWHYLNIDEGQTLETMPRNPKGDVLTAVTALVAELKAGGLAPEADVTGLNRASKVVDGQKIHVPTVGEQQASIAEAGVDGGTSASPGVSGATGLVNINTANAAELQTLSGIGPSMAQSIIDERTKNGAFASVDDLMRVSGIGEKKLAKIKDCVCV